MKNIKEKRRISEDSEVRRFKALLKFRSWIEQSLLRTPVECLLPH